MNILGLDYGKSHIGVAISMGPLADPFATLQTKLAIKDLGKLIKENSIEQIVIGDCDAGFLEELKGLGVPIEIEDETLTSHDAREALMHTTQKRRHENEHAVAAALILQGWLDSKGERV